MPEQNLGDLIRNAKPGGFTPIPAGTYKVVVDSASYSQSSNGNPMFALVLKVVEDEEYEDRKLWNRVTITEASVGIAVQTMEAFGISQEQLAAAITDDPDEVCKELAAGEVVALAKVTQKEFRGEMRNEVRRIVALATPGEDGPAKASGAKKSGSKTSRPDKPF